MAEGAGAPVDVQLLVRDAQFAHGDHGDDSEGLVDLEEIDIGDRPAGLGQSLLHGRDRRGGEEARLMGVGGVTGDAGDNFQAQALCHRSAGQHQGRGAVADRGGIGGGNGAVGTEGGAQGGDLGGVGLQGCFVGFDEDDALFGAGLDGRDLAGKGAALHRPVRLSSA